MHENEKKQSYRAGAEQTATLTDAERRTSNRHMFTASADVIDVTSGARFSTRTTDLGPGGCFIDTTNPFPVGSKVRMILHKGKNEFETPGIVVYSQYGLGMGIAFNEVDCRQRVALDAWISELNGGAPAHEAQQPVKAFDPSLWSRPGADRAPLVRLVRLMITKGILTEAEGSSVLVDPLL